MKWLYLLIVVLLPFFAVCQTQEELIAETVCSNLSTLDLTEASATLNQKALGIIQKVYQDFQPKTAKLLESYRKKYDNKSDIELSKLIGQQVTVHLMDECVTYQRMTMFDNQPVPEISNTAMQIGKEFTTLLSEKMQTGGVSQDLIDNCVMQVTDKHARLITEEYGDRYAPQFIKEFQTYLMTESMPYMKWMASQIK